MVKHAAMEQRPGIRVNCPIGKLVGDRICDTITQTSDTITQKSAVLSHKPAVPSPKLKTAANVLYEENGLVLFKSELPHTVDLFERVDGNKIKQIASFYRQSDEAALAAGKAYMRVRSIKCTEL